MMMPTATIPAASVCIVQARRQAPSRRVTRPTATTTTCRIPSVKSGAPIATDTYGNPTLMMMPTATIPAASASIVQAK